MSQLQQNIAYNNTTGDIFAATENGLYKSEDDGITWTQTLSTGGWCFSVFINNNDDIFAYTEDGNYNYFLKYSHDNAETWIDISLPDNTEFDLTTIYSSDSTIIIAVESGDVYTSHNLGNTWNKVINLSQHQTFIITSPIVKSEDGTLFLGMVDYVIVADLGDVYRSYDNGDTWESTLSGANISSLAIDSNGTIYGTHYTGSAIVKSENMGDSWQFISEDILFPFCMTIDKNDYIYACEGIAIDVNNYGLNRSTDHGITWETLTTGLPEEPVITSIYALPNNYVYAMCGNNLGLYRSVNPVYTPPLKGDADNNGIIDFADIQTIISYMFNLNPEPFNFTNADVNNDGVINILDVMKTIMIIMDR